MVIVIGHYTHRITPMRHVEIAPRYLNLFARFWPIIGYVKASRKKNKSNWALSCSTKELFKQSFNRLHLTKAGKLYMRMYVNCRR